MDALDLAILALRVALVAVLYAFVLVVLRFSARGLLPTVPRAVSTPTPTTDGLQLIVVEGGHSGLRAGQVVEIAPGATLGRTPDADVVVADPAVSARHARISRLGRTWTVSDLGSTNGTLVNDERIQAPAPLASGDVLSLGSVRLKVLGG